MQQMLRTRIMRLDSEIGQTLVEYALLIALIALVAIGGLELVAGPSPGIFSRIASHLNP
jgi:Flp pilus assembly pilin Flp